MSTQDEPANESDRAAATPATGIPWWRRARVVLPALVVVGFAIAAAVHQAPFQGWYIEDAAISFAFARNWADGAGLVPTPGTERTEGYSNFTWVALLALAELLGFDSFDASKVLQYALAFLTVPFTWLLAREAASDARSYSPLLAAGYLAVASTFAIWGASGLENGLFGLFLAIALWRSAVETRTGGFPWAALAWCLLAMTRPEGILYAALAGGLSMLFTARAFGLRPTLLWLLTFFVPFGLYHAVRFWYFAWEFPQTYYGKMTLKEPDPFAWQRRGWKYVRNWAHALWTAYLLPVWFFGVTGVRGWRTAIATALLGVTAFWLVYPHNEALTAVGWPSDLPAPSWWIPGRSYLLALDAILLPLIAIGGGRGWRARALCSAVACGVLFFAVYTLGDWMKAWRWMNLLQVPLAVLFATGVGAFAEALDAGLTALAQRIRPVVSGGILWGVAQIAVLAAWFAWGDRFAYGPWPALALGEGALLAALLGGVLSHRGRDPWTLGGWTLAALALGVMALPNLTHTRAQNGRPETGPFAIKSRVDYVRGLAETLDLDGPIVDLDVDMGGHLWWGADRFRMLDIAGLVDIPFAQHRFERAFVHEYVFEEMRPHFAHLHGNWASTSRIPTHPEWRTDYIEVPGYPAGRSFHIGNHVRRDLLFRPAWPHGRDRRVAFDGGVVLEGFRIPSEPARARLMWFEIGFRDTVRRKDGEDVTVLAFARGPGGTHTWNVPLAHGWVPASAWRNHEVFVGGIRLAVPQHLTEGVYDVGFVVMDPKGRVLAPSVEEPLPEGARAPATREEAVIALGEVVFPGALTVVSLDALSELAMADREASLEHARRGRCEQAEQSWWLARKHRPVDKAWAADHAPRVNLQLATCWAWRAEQEPDRAVEFLERARNVDPYAPGYVKNRDPVADQRIADGLAAREAGDHDAAYQAFRDALRVDPSRAWARRWAEQERVVRLELDPGVRRRKPAPAAPAPPDRPDADDEPAGGGG